MLGPFGGSGQGPPPSHWSGCRKSLALDIRFVAGSAASANTTAVADKSFFIEALLFLPIKFNLVGFFLTSAPGPLNDGLKARFYRKRE